MSINPLNDITRVYLDQVATPQLDERVRPGNVETPLDKAAFKKRRRSLAGKEKSAEARSRGHEGKEWYNSGRTYSPDEAKRGRAKLDDAERSTRHRSALDPEGDDRLYSADKTKNPKKLRKQKAMGELGEAKVDEKLPEHERATARDKRSGINLPGSGTRRTRRAEHEARRGKPKRWWDDDGDGIGWEKGEVKEVKKWFDNDGDGIGYEPGEVSGRFRRKKKKSVKEGYSDWRSDLIEVMDVIDNKEKNDDKIVEKKVKNKIKINPTLGEAIENLGGVLLEMEELDEKAYRGLGVGRVERVSSGSYQAPETTGAAAKRKKAEEPKPVVAVKRKKAEQPKTAVAEKPAPKEAGRPARKRRSNSPSYAEVKAEIEAREQAKKRKGKKKKKSPLDDLLSSIRSEEVQINEMPYQVMGSPDGKKEKKIGKPVKSKKYADARAAELEDTHKKTGGKYRSEYVESVELIDEKTLTKKQMKKREEIAQSMDLDDFERRYPGRGMEVKMATATKMAKKIAK